MSETELSNGMTEGALRALVHKELQFRRKRKSLADDHKAARHHVKTYGVDLKDFDIAIEQMTADDGGDRFVSKLARQHRLMKILDLPVAKRFSAGDQLDLGLDEPAGNKKLKNGVSKQFRDGSIAHLDGKTEKDNPHAVNSEEGQDWLEGYRYSVDLCKEGSEELKRILNDEPPKGAAARGTLPADPPKPADKFGGVTILAEKKKKRATKKKATAKAKPKKDA